MKNNPVLRESVAVFFAEGRGFQVYFYLLVILGPVQFFALYLPSLDAQAWSGSAGLFKVTAVTALLLIVYFALRVANQEFSPWRFKALRRWVIEDSISLATIGQAQRLFLALHVACSALLCAPFLIWAGAIARTPQSRVAGTLLLLLFYPLMYGVWGLAALVFWERHAESRQVFIRCFFFALLLLSALFYLPLNPAAYLLAFLGQQEPVALKLGDWQLPARVVHFGFHLLLGGAGWAAHRWALRRELGS